MDEDAPSRCMEASVAGDDDAPPSPSSMDWVKVDEDDTTAATSTAAAKAAAAKETSVDQSSSSSLKSMIDTFVDESSTKANLPKQHNKNFNRTLMNILLDHPAMKTMIKKKMGWRKWQQSP